MMKEHLAWAKKYRSWTVNEWKKLLITEHTLKLLKGWLVRYSSSSVVCEGGDYTCPVRRFPTDFLIYPLLGLGMVAVGLFIIELHSARGRSRGFSRCQRLPGDDQRQDSRNTLRMHVCKGTRLSCSQKEADFSAV
ncbi:hypothetical protein TNCV_1045881 [Trichonephila clavipes]|nr:hypothetical protein TNCV_1045881 [Trichonephila clavipes]